MHSYSQKCQSDQQRLEFLSVSLSDLQIMFVFFFFFNIFFYLLECAQICCAEHCCSTFCFFPLSLSLKLHLLSTVSLKKKWHFFIAGTYKRKKRTGILGAELNVNIDKIVSCLWQSPPPPRLPRDDDALDSNCSFLPFYIATLTPPPPPQLQLSPLRGPVWPS